MGTQRAIDFTALDFETANSFRGSPCAVALVRFRGGVPVETWNKLMRPPVGHDHFDRMNTSIHGITPADVATAPRFAELLPSLVEFVGEDVIVAHNAAFDTSVIRYAADASEVEWPTLHYICTLALSRRALSLPSYSLPWVADELGVPLTTHHDPVSDATAAGDILQALCQRQGAPSVSELLDSLGMGVGTLAPAHWRGFRSLATTPGGDPELPTSNPDADPNHTLFGRNVVFTGRLDSMTRQSAGIELARVGGVPQKGVTKTTNILVIGPDEYDGQVLTGEHMTGKMAKVEAMRRKGAAVEIMAEIDFLRSL